VQRWLYEHPEIDFDLLHCLCRLLADIFAKVTATKL
jgi:hypothetical protein